MKRWQALFARCKREANFLQARSNIRHVSEIERAIRSVDPHCAAPRRSEGECRYYSIRMIIDIAVHARESCDSGSQASLAGVQNELLGRDLRTRIDVLGHQLRSLRNREDGLLTVDFAAARVYQPWPASTVECQSQNLPGRVYIDSPALLRIALPPDHPGDAAEMDDTGRVRDCAFEGAVVAQITECRLSRFADIEAKRLEPRGPHPRYERAAN